MGIKCENHAAAITLLKCVFGIDNSGISKAKSDRVDKRYYVDFTINSEETVESIAVAGDFIANLADFLARITEEDVKKFREATVKSIRALW